MQQNGACQENQTSKIKQVLSDLEIATQYTLKTIRCIHNIDCLS